MLKESKSFTNLRLHSSQRILMLDGAMGTMIQNENLTEEDYRGNQFTQHSNDLKGNNDILSISQPDLIKKIHRQYLDSGADIILTNTFNATSISQADYATEDMVPQINFESAKIAKEVALDCSEDNKPRFVAGSIGPTNKTTSISPDVTDPGYRAIDFKELRDSYKQQALALINGGVDIFILETIFDTLNAKAGLSALFETFRECGNIFPIMISGTITDLSGRTLTGQTPEAFFYSMRHANPFSIGLNCALGAAHMRPYISELSRGVDTRICAYPNAGLPNEFGEYDETAETTAEHIGEWADSGLLNIVGGCCGTTPEHMLAISEAIIGKPPRKIPNFDPKLKLSGLEPLAIEA